MTETRTALVANREIIDQVPFVQGQTTGALVPQNMGQALELAKIMAGGNIGVPKHLRGQPAVCMRVITDALQFALNPFHLASDSYVVNDQLAYGAKSIHAMTMRSGMVDGRLDITYEGEGANLICRVSGRLRGSAKPSVKTVRLSQIKTMNSPLWKTDPQQQLGYYTERAWCRLYAPDTMMGLVAREDPIIDVTPEAVSIDGDAPRDALAEVEAHLGTGDGPDHETQSANGDLEGSRPGAAAAVQGRDPQNQGASTPAPEREVADSAGQQSNGGPVSDMLGNLRHDLAMQKSADERNAFLAQPTIGETVAGLSEPEQAIWRQDVESARGELG